MANVQVNSLSLLATLQRHEVDEAPNEMISVRTFDVARFVYVFRVAPSVASLLQGHPQWRPLLLLERQPVDLAPSLAHLDAWRELARLWHVGPGANVPRT